MRRSTVAVGRKASSWGRLLSLALFLAWALSLSLFTPSLQAKPRPAATPTVTPAPEARALFEKAQDAFREKRFKDARNHLLELIGRFPVEDVIPRSKVLLAELEEDFDVSLEQLKALAKEYYRQPEGQAALQELAQRYYLADRYEEAADTYREYLERYAGQSDEAETRYWYGSSLLAAGKGEEAMGQFEKSLALDPEGPWAPKSRLARGSLFLKQRRYDDAQKELLVILDRHPHFGEQNQVFLKLGRAFEAAGMPREGRASYRTLLDRFPKSMEASEARDRLAAIDRAYPRLAGGKKPSLWPEAPATATPFPTATAVVARVPLKPTPTAAPPSGRPFRVQVGVYTRLEFARETMKKLEKWKYKPTLLTVGGAKSVYKVRVGHFADKEQAAREAKNIKRKIGLPTLVVEE